MPSLPPPALACNATRLSAAGGSGTDALTARMLPSLFVPGMPKAGTSFVWGCLMEAFRPSRVCQSDSASDWRQCAGRQYVLPALTAGRDGLVSPAAKEPFTFVRDGGLDWTALKSGDPSALGQLLGPALPLCQWEFDQQAATIPATVEASSTFRLRKFLASRDRHESPRLAALRQALKHRMSLYCRQGVPNMVTTRRMSCVTSEDGTTSFRTALPVVSEMGTARARVVDATPNYLTSPDALRRIHWLHAAAPSAVRFVVLLRDPIERTLSEYRMFHAWGWDRGALAPKLERQIAELGRCAATTCSALSGPFTPPPSAPYLSRGPSADRHVVVTSPGAGTRRLPRQHTAAAAAAAAARYHNRRGR